MKSKVNLSTIHKVCNEKKSINKFEKLSRSKYAIKNDKKTRNIFKWIYMTLIGILIFVFSSKIAFLERGYNAYGGEFLFLMLPFWYWLIKNMFADMLNILKNKNVL